MLVRPVRAPSPLALALLTGLASGCGAGAPEILFGGISSGGNKPPADDEATGGTRPPLQQDPPAPGAADGEAEGKGCEEGPSVTGERFVQEEAKPACDDAHELACVVELSFDEAGLVRLALADAAAQTPLVSYAQCGHRLYVALELQGGELAVEELVLAEDGLTLRHLRSGRTFVKAR